MTYFTGDIHGSPIKIQHFCRQMNLTANDTVVILGDVGANYYGDSRDGHMKKRLAALAPTIFCIHGNHERRPSTISDYELTTWNGGAVWVQPEYPNLLFAKDGEVYDIAGKKAIVIGGAYSVDKWYRLQSGLQWFSDEQPSAEIKNRVEQKLDALGWKVDLVWTHTCPEKYTPREAFLSGINQASVDNSTEQWLNTIEDRLEYDAWYCGHWHINKRIDRMHFLMEGYEEIHPKEEKDNG